jgi:nucleotide-binding universal stress UspA family protein
MYHCILVPLDGSAFAEHALPIALGIARRSGATLDLVRAHVPYAIEAPAAAAPVFDPTIDTVLEHQERAYLESVAKRLREVAPVRITAAVVSGLAADGIVERAAQTSAELIVSATHARGPLGRFWLGSVADELIRLAPVPLLLLHPHEETVELAREPSFKRILVPLDGSGLAERVLEPAVELGRTTAAELVLLRVVDATARNAADQRSTDDAQADAQKYVELVAANLRLKGLAVHTEIMSGQPADAILERSNREVDLVALSTHGRTGLMRLFLGSVADKVLRRIAVPLLLVRPPAESRS